MRYFFRLICFQKKMLPKTRNVRSASQVRRPKKPAPPIILPYPNMKLTSFDFTLGKFLINNERIYYKIKCIYIVA